MYLVVEQVGIGEEVGWEKSTNKMRGQQTAGRVGSGGGTPFSKLSLESPWSTRGLARNPGQGRKHGSQTLPSIGAVPTKGTSGTLPRPDPQLSRSQSDLFLHLSPESPPTGGII